ncbi:MAX gene-associated protein isoform X3 [Pseudophryne corroboree]|uniref:MAX gene-associated protein isoform X3 n=1 Tax=Pseudophryne corroboree TaxID=495146 RepID=UPI0030821B32
MEKNQTPKGDQECGSKPPSNTPAYFVILHQSQGDGSKEEGILVANRDVSSVAPFVSVTPDKSKSDVFLSANCVSKEITVTLDNNNMWNEFYRCSTEMVLTKQGRRMFPYCRYWISGLDPYLKYILVMDITPLDTHRYKWNGKWWESGGKAEPHVLGRVFIHPESPSTGQFWMHQPISFYKLKLTNNILDQEGHIILHSMHRYLPRLHVIPAEKATEVIQLNGPDVHTFTFPQTEFIAVTAYQNFQITQLKIDCNPFAKGFREGAVLGRFPKESKHKDSEQGSADSKVHVENDDPESIKKLREIFRMSEHSDCDTENEVFNAGHDVLNSTNALSRIKEILQQKEDNRDRCDERSGTASPPAQPNIKIKQEPEDNYDYNKTITTERLQIKQEESEDEVTDEYSNSDDDYPILERHFARFTAGPHRGRKRSSQNIPSGVAKAKLLKLGNSSLPKVYLKSCLTDKNAVELPDLQDPVLSDSATQSTGVCDTPLSEERCLISPSPTIISNIKEEFSEKSKSERCKYKVNVKCETPQTALSTPHLPKQKLPFLLHKSSVTGTPGNEMPIVKKRGRPRKPKVSKEALAVHTGKKPKNTGTFHFPAQPDSSGENEEARKIAELERQLVAQLRTMRYRQVIHPALQQVGLKLNIVDLTMSIDLRYLGVELPLRRITNNSRWDIYGLCAQASEFPFMSRTGKTSDYTKIKGWRDKFSTNSTVPPIKIEAIKTENSLKNRSAFCSDELDEYLENEAKLMGDIKGLYNNEPVSSISYQLPTKSSSYVRTLDSVLKKQAPQPKPSSNSLQPLPLPIKKRKYTRRNFTPKAKSKSKSISPPIVTIKEKLGKPRSAGKKKNITAPCTEETNTVPFYKGCLPAASQPMMKPPVAEHKVKIQPPVGKNVCQSLQGTLKPHGLQNAQLKLMYLEECAVWEGKPRTLITEERADFSLSTLLTAQASLKTKPMYKMIYRRAPSCNKEFCRLGCICSSLSLAMPKATHCRRVNCMLNCDCLKSKLYLGKDGFQVKSARPTQEEEDDAEGKDYSSSIYEDCNNNQQAENKTHEAISPVKKEFKEIVEDFKTKKRKALDCNDRDSEFQSFKSYPIWNRSDLENDPEPICIPEQAEFVDSKELHYKVPLQKSKSSAVTKSSHLHTPTTVVPPEEMDPIYKYFDSMMTCARVRVHERKAPDEKAKKDQCIDDGFDTSGKDHGYKSCRRREQAMEDPGQEELGAEKRWKVDTGSTKLIDIMSDCNWEEDRSKTLNNLSQSMNSREPQSFKVGSFNIQLVSENKHGDKSVSSTAASRVKISMDPGQKTNKTIAKPPLVKRDTESVKPLDQNPQDICAEKETKSHGGKGLPFYTKVLPAGKLVARLKNSTINQSELIQVNGKSYPQAKLLLGQMGALHPANRLAAYITHRLRPSLFHLSKLTEAHVKMANKNPTLESNVNSKTTWSVDETGVTSLQHNTAVQSTPSNVFTQIVIGDVRSLHQEMPEVSSPESTITGLPKLTTQSTRLLFVTSPAASGKQAPVVAYSSAVNMTSLSAPSLSSGALGTISPTRTQASSSALSLTPETKLIIKGASVSIPAGLVASSSNDGIHTVTLTTVPSTKKSVTTPSILSSPLVKALPPQVTSAAAFCGTDKAIATSLAKSLVTSTDLPTHESVAPLAGTNIAPSLTLKTVAPSSVSTLSPTAVTSGLDKRLGPRLLLIPVSTGSTPVRPVQCVQTAPGQKMVLQPIKTPNGVNLFRHPNGQILQLVPLHQVRTGNTQQSSQQVVIRKQGPAMGIRIPLPTKPESVCPTSSSISSTSITSAPAALPVVTISKTSPVKSGVTIVPSNPFVLSQFGTLTMNTAQSAVSDVSLPPSKVVAYSSGVVPTNVTPLQSGGFSLVKVPPSAVPSASPQISAPKSNIVLMIDKPEVVKDSNNADKPKADLLLSPVESALNEKLAWEDNLPFEELPRSERKTEVQDHTEDSVRGVQQEGITQSKERMSSGEPCNEWSSNKHSSMKDDVADKFKASDGALLQEFSKKRAHSPTDKGTQRPAFKSNQSLVKGDQSSSETVLPCDPKQVESAASLSADQQILRETGDKSTKSSLFKENNARHEIVAYTANQQKVENLTVDLLVKDSTNDEREIPDIDKDISECNSSSDDYSEDNSSVDVETVEELSEKIKIARLKATAPTVTSDTEKYGTQSKFSIGRKKGFKMNGNYISTVDDKNYNVYYRRNHTANERKRRNDMRDLFDELKNALGLHNLPKVSKSYILKQAIEEIEGLTDSADTLIRKKTSLSQKQSKLIKKLSKLSGKPKEVVLKKLEYVYAKQKAVEAERKKLNLEEDLTPLKSSANSPSPKRNPLPPPLKLEEETNEASSSKTKKPIILARKPVLLSMESKPHQLDVPLASSNLLMAATGQEVTLNEAGVAGQVAGIPPTLLQADLSPAQLQPGMTSVVIQLPGAIQLKGIIGNGPGPITLSAVPGTISALAQSPPESDDLSMMPKIVNVTSLANDVSSDLSRELGMYTPVVEKGTKCDAHTPLPEPAVEDIMSFQAMNEVSSMSYVPSMSILLNNAEENFPDLETQGPDGDLIDHLPLSVISSTNNEISSKSVSMDHSSFSKLSENFKDSELELELNKLSCAIDNVGLDPSALSDVIGDQEDADETLTSLLNEIALLNQQLNNDTDDLDSDFAGSDTVSRCSVSKFTDGDSSPFSFGRFRELSETREKNISLSPLFLQLEEGEIQESIKHNDDGGIVVFEDIVTKEPLINVVEKPCGVQKPQVTVLSCQTTEKQLSSGSDVLWKPMPKLAPLGLKSPTLTSDQKILGSLPMPTLASVAMRLNPPKPAD